MKGKITVIGSSNTDMIFKMAAMPKPGETIIGGEFYKAHGGKGANQAVAAARAGADVNFICRVGNDDLGKASVEHYTNEGINTRHIIHDDGKPSGVAGIFVDEKGENSIAVASGANNNLSCDDIINSQKALADCDIVLLQLEIPLDTVISVIELASQKGKKVILNPAPAQKLPEELLKKITIITPNEHEAEMISGIKVKDEKSAIEAAEKLISKGIKTVLITMGSQGVFFMDESNCQIIPAYKVEAVDSTAAGDVFNGALAVALSENKAIEEAIKFASAAAAISVTRMGAQPSIPTRIEIENFLNPL